MHKRWAVTIALIAAVLLLAVRGAAAQDNRSLVWERWDVVIDDVDTANNTFRVTETYVIDFNGRYSFGAANIPLTNMDGINDVRVSDRGQRLTAACFNQAGTFCARTSGGALDITYYFTSPITDGRGTFVISYEVSGALRVYEGGDQLWWNAVPDDHYGYPIRSSTITVDLPSGFAPREGIDPIETEGARGEISVSGTEVTATAINGIGGYEGFSIRVQYPHDPNARVPAWQSSFDSRRDYEENVMPLVNLGVIALGLLLGLGLPLLFFVLWQTRGRDPKIGPVPTFLSEPPSSLPPAVVGTLVDERSDPRDVISTIVDLAQRGYLVIEETQTQGLFGIGSSSQFTFKRTDKAFSDLRPYERRLMDRLFSGSSMERSMASLTNTFYTTISQIQNDLYDELVTEGFFTTKPNVTRGLWGAIGVILIFGTVALTVILAPLLEGTTQFMFCIPIGLFIAAAAAFAFGNAMPAKTLKGSEEAAKWKAFYEYLNNLENYGGVETAAERFASYLPYAVAFGIDKEWVRRFTRVPTATIPPWYYPTYLGGPWGHGYRPGTPIYGTRGLGGLGEGGLPGDLTHASGGGFSLDQMSGNLSQGLESISSGLTSMVDSASRAMTSRPQQTSSGGSGSWSSGGRSWSGGGFSGGGGSGGGSRGFG